VTPPDDTDGLSTEQRNEPNHTLYQNWERVFRKIPGFEECVCLRRVRCPDHKDDPDFFLLTARPVPCIGIVECEGFNSRDATDRPVSSEGVEQLRSYFERWKPYRGKGEVIYKESIQDAFQTKLRRENNLALWGGGLDEWIAKATSKATPDEKAMIELLDAASQNIVSILLYYRGNRFKDEQVENFARAFRHRPFFVGTVWWPEADKLTGGRLLS